MATREELIALALKTKVPIATLDPTCQWVDSKEQAAVDAFARLPDQKKEESGAIYQNKAGQFCYSIPVQGGEKSFKFKTDQSGGLKFDSIYHTHPDSGYHERGVSSDNFSPDDVKIANQLKRDSFIRINRTGDVKKFIPGVTPLDRHTQASRGEVIDSERTNLLVNALRSQ